MAEYIESEFNPCDVCNYKRCSNCALHELAMKVVGHPAADVAPVKYGRWVLIETGYGAKIYECSECKDDDYWKHHFAGGFEHYCPNCGARMDGE